MAAKGVLPRRWHLCRSLGRALRSSLAAA